MLGLTQRATLLGWLAHGFHNLEQQRTTHDGGSSRPGLHSGVACRWPVYVWVPLELHQSCFLKFGHLRDPHCVDPDCMRAPVLNGRLYLAEQLLVLASHAFGKVPISLSTK